MKSKIEETNVEEKDRVKILWILTSNEGETYDDEERPCGFDTRTILKEDIVKREKVYDALMSIFEIPADYGDGVTNSKLLCVVDAETNDILPKDIEYWKPVDYDELW